jgi:IS4 transposase
MSDSLFGNPVFQNFADKRPVAVTAQMILRRLLDPDTIDELFRENAELQYEQTLLFSAITRMMSSVTLGTHKSVNAAFRKMRDEIGVSITAVYNKLQRIEPQITAAMVRHAYQQTIEVERQIGSVKNHDIPGLVTRVLDGNHLSKTEHRIKETRDLVAGPLPGKSLVVFDPRYDAISDMFPIEDGHAQELSALDDVIETIVRDELWIADRNFCTLKFMYAIISKHAYFVIRQHGKLHGKICGKLKKAGKTETAEIFENRLELPSYDGQVVVVRRIVVRLKNPTRDGDSELVILTNLPVEKAGAVKVSDLYRSRWKIETAFMHMTLSLNCEVNTLCYPPAALFCFGTALVAYNAISILKALVTRTFGRDQMESLSHYYVALEISETTDGLLLAIPSDDWSWCVDADVDEFAERLLEVVSSMDVSTYRKSVRGPKKPPPKKKGNKRTVHVSTKRILDKRKQNSC